MFSNTRFNRCISNWDVYNVDYMNMMFYKSDFNGDISEWKVSNVTDKSDMFIDSGFSSRNKPNWYY